jgi:fatty acid desaturase
MSTAAIDQEFGEIHEPHWVLRSAFQFLVFGLVAAEVTLAITVHRGLIWLAVLIALVVSHLMHGLLIGLHEAAHGLLRKNRRFNEFDGLIIGFLSLMSFSLYRVVHQTHHAFLASERDWELWPFARTTTPRWRRCLAAFIELTFGLFYSPIIFLRGFLCSASAVRRKSLRRRIWTEWALIFLGWTVILGVVATFGVWKYFLWMYLGPAMLAADLQNWRKYIEHVGMTGDTVNSSTRSIVARSWMGRLFAFTLLHEPFHGVHHQRAGLPHSVLPQFADKLEPKNPGERAPFAGYRYALLDLMHCLADPRVGAQWRTLQPRA